MVKFKPTLATQQEYLENSSPLLWRIRIALLAGAIYYPVLGYLQIHLNPNQFDLYIMRGLMAVLATTGIVLSFAWPNFRKRKVIENYFAVCLTLAAMHATLRVYMNHFTLLYTTIFALSAGAICLASLNFRQSLALMSWFSISALGSFFMESSLPDGHSTLMFLTIFLLFLVPLTQFTMDRVFVEQFHARQEFGQILDQLQEAIFLQGERSGLVYFNRKAPEILGLTPSELYSRTFADLRWEPVDEQGNAMPPERYPSRVALESDTPQYGIVIGIHRPDGSLRWLRVNAEPAQVKLIHSFSKKRQESIQERYVLTTFEDITREKEMNAAIAETRAKMTESARLTSLGESAAGIAHEINNPLAIVRLSLEQMSEWAPHIPSDEKLKFLGALEMASKASRRIAALVQGMRGLSRNAENDPIVPSELKTILSEVTPLFQQKLKTADIELRINIDSTPQVLCRSSQIAQVLTNLIQNSIDAIAEHLRSNPDLRKVPQWIEIQTKDNNGFVELTLRDSGPGIRDAIRGNIMQPFFTTKPPGQGVGIGLSISRSILISHGGALDVCANNPGACFRMKLKRA